MTVTKHETIAIHTCVDALKIKNDGQRRKQSLHIYLSSQSKKTKFSEKEAHQGNGKFRSLSNIIITKLTEAFNATDKPASSLIKIQWKIIANPLHIFKRVFRGLEKEVSIKIYFTFNGRQKC